MTFYFSELLLVVKYKMANLKLYNTVLEIRGMQLFSLAGHFWTLEQQLGPVIVEIMKSNDN